MKYSLGIDVGSSSVKVSLMAIESGRAVASSTNPSAEMPITALRSGWAEQSPEMWWRYVVDGIKAVGCKCNLSEVVSIGITYQMHGLVVVDANGKPLRDSIIWCDSRAVEIGRDAFDRIGADRCLKELLNSPGNFTASKLAWVARNEPELFDKIDKMMLPGDYIAYRLSGQIATTATGLSEGIMWNFLSDDVADSVLDCYSIPRRMLPDTVPSIGVGCTTDAAFEQLTGIKAGTPVSYRAGDQPNNAFSLRVLNAGDIAATAGTSGVVYGVIDRPKADPLSRVNTFVHVNHTAGDPRYGVLLCINGTGIMNAWTRRVAATSMSYEQINALCATVDAGCDGLTVLPFGNGAERMLGNRLTGASVSGIDLNRHTAAHLLRAAQEGIAFAFRYGIDIMRSQGLNPSVIRAGQANMFLSPLFRSTLSTVCGVGIELYNTDGSLGAARGAALGAGFYATVDEAFASLEVVGTTAPDQTDRKALDEAYERWRNELEMRIKQ